MKKQIQLIELLTEKLVENTKEHIALKEAYTGNWFSKDYMSKNYGKTALKRQIVMLRQELLNLSDTIDKE